MGTPAASMIVHRLGRETAKYTAVDISGAGAAASGGRWNEKSLPVLYTSMTRALACLESLVHLTESTATPVLPLDRYLLDIAFPEENWLTATHFVAKDHPGWDALPESVTALTWGSNWLRSRSSLIAVVPSVIVPDELNVLINPLHPDFAGVKRVDARKWHFDPRL
jgi:RES domain-containing protein